MQVLFNIIHTYLVHAYDDDGFQLQQILNWYCLAFGLNTQSLE